MEPEGFPCDGVRVRTAARDREVRVVRKKRPLGQKRVRLSENGRRFGEFFPKRVREFSSEHDLEVVRQGNHHGRSQGSFMRKRLGAGSERVGDRRKKFLGEDGGREPLLGRKKEGIAVGFAKKLQVFAHGRDGESELARRARHVVFAVERQEGFEKIEIEVCGVGHEKRAVKEKENGGSQKALERMMPQFEGPLVFRQEAPPRPRAPRE